MARVVGNFRVMTVWCGGGFMNGRRPRAVCVTRHSLFFLRRPWLGDAVAFTLGLHGENAVFEKGDECEVLAVGEFELEFDGAGAIFVEVDDFALIEISPIGFAKEGDDFVFGGLPGHWRDLISD